jgi:5-methyltetrahydropteroyltriglutamate--homocysteine methyltransferase
MVQAIHEHMEGRLAEADFTATAEDATRLAVEAQLRAGVDVVTDGEQRRDNYASFVGGRLDNCQLIPLTDLLPLVDDPETFEREMQSLDVPAAAVRHPAVFGPLGRRRPLAVHEFEFVRTITDRTVKVALPGPYLLTRIMWMECISDRAYRSREHLAVDVVRVLREEIAFLLAAGTGLVQLDEPVLSRWSSPASRTPVRSCAGR